MILTGGQNIKQLQLIILYGKRHYDRQDLLEKEEKSSSTAHY